MHSEYNYHQWKPDKVNPHDPSFRKEVAKVKPITIEDLFPRLDRLSIGWSPLLEQLKQVTANKPTYPPYDIIELEDGVNTLNVAVAGFTKDDLKVVVQDSVLTITGEKQTKPKGEVVYQGIAARDFELKLAIAEFWEVTDAMVQDGLLTVLFTKNLPEEKKPKVIDIH